MNIKKSRLLDFSGDLSQNDSKLDFWVRNPRQRGQVCPVTHSQRDNDHKELVWHEESL